MICGMARKERSTLERVLAMAIFLVIGLVIGIGVGFYMAFESPAGQAQPAPAEGEADSGSAPANELCIIQLRDADGRIRADLLNAALTDVGGKQDVAVEVDGQASLRFACPAAKTSAELLARSTAGEFFFVQGVELDAAQPYLALDSGDATDTAGYLAGREGAGVAGEAPAWLSEPVPEGAAEGEEGGEEAEPTGEPHDLEGSINVEVRDLDGTVMTKGDIRDFARQNAWQYEDCVKQHGEGLPRVRHSHYVAVEPSGKVATALVLQGINPEFDACVDTMLGRWTFTEGESASFFKLKLVYQP